MARLELYGTARCPYTQEMREWLEWNAARVSGIRRGRRCRGPRAGCATLTAASARFRYWWRMEKLMQIGWQGHGVSAIE